MNRQVSWAKNIGRRRFLRLAGASALALAVGPSRVSGTGYAVGAGVSASPYEATQHAITSCGNWPPPNLVGRRVLVKPNLVMALPAATGCTTDPQAVRAIVDLALAAGAAAVTIVGGFPDAANFSGCGYDFFNSYDPGGRVSLLDLDSRPTVLATVQGGITYRQIYMPQILFEADVFLITAGKMKVHSETLASLATKNMFGLPPATAYRYPTKAGRFVMHDRGVHQSIADVNWVRRADFAVVDGVVAMERRGPWGGTPVAMNLALAGDNAVAVDRVCLYAMGIPQGALQHLTYCSLLGLGPFDMGNVQTLGDPIVPRSFALPTSSLPPVVYRPSPKPPVFSPSAGQSTRISYWVDRPCLSRVEIVSIDDASPQVVTHVRWLRRWAATTQGTQSLVWHGLNDQGSPVPPGSYTIRVEATRGESTHNAFATNWVDVGSL